MARLEFPDSPTLNQVYTGDNGVTYTWNGTYWAANDGEALDDRYVQVVGDTMTGNLTVPSMNTGQLAGLRNQLINGDFYVAQRAATGSGTGYVTLDRWYQYNVTGNVFTQRQDGFGPFAQSIRLLDNETSGDAYIAQGIELPFSGYQGQFETGSTWTLSFWSTVATSASNIGIAWQDTISSAGGVANTVGSVVIGETLSGYTHYSFLVTISATAPVTSTCLRVLIGYTAPVDASITGVQFEPGPVATPFENIPIQTELALCQRYFYRYTVSTNVALFSANAKINTDTISAGAASSWTHNLNFPVEMRTSPTGSNYINNGANDYVVIPGYRAVASAIVPSDMSSYTTPTTSSLNFDANVGGYPLTQGSSYPMEAAFSYDFDAEL